MSPEHFISVQRARELLLQDHSMGPIVQRSLQQASMSILAHDLFSPIDLPPFAQSSVDGFALAVPNTPLDQYLIIGESSAGRPFHSALQPGEAVRIMTGAELPQGTVAVVMQEYCRAQAHVLEILDTNEVSSQHMRAQGSQLQRSDLVLRRGSLLHPASLSLLASMGVRKVPTFESPKINLILSGDELQLRGSRLKPSMIFESNQDSLRGALRAEGLQLQRVLHCRDTADEVEKALHQSLQEAQYILFCGGASVGDYDFVPAAIRHAGLDEIFYKVQQRPGKPLLYARHHAQHIFALPGNPASVLCCFYEYVLPSLRRYRGFSQVFLPSIELSLAADVSKKTKLQHFERAWTNLREVWPLKGQESYKMKSFAEANCLLVLDADKQHFAQGSKCEVHLLPHALQSLEQSHA